MSDIVVVERPLRHPPEKIWRALTQHWLLEEWLMPNNFVVEVGRSFTFRTSPVPHWNGIVTGVVQSAEPPHRLRLSWNTENPDGAPGLRTIVEFTIKPTSEGAILRVEQSGFALGQDANLRGAQLGWQRNLERLEEAIGSKS